MKKGVRPGGLPASRWGDLDPEEEAFPRESDAVFPDEVGLFDEEDAPIVFEDDLFDEAEAALDLDEVEVFLGRRLR
jgi:hypothetical protein